MLGIVLCGGASSRMGQDKGLIVTEYGNWGGKMLGNFEKLGIQSMLSINKTQVEQYKSVFPKAELICDNDLLKIKGPLAAVLSVHLKYPTEDLFVTACDMPLMDEMVLEDLVDHYKKIPGHDCYVYTNEGETEPLCGIYSAKGLTTAKAMYDHAELLKHSMKFMLDHLSTLRIPIPGKWKACFRNINTHADLNGM